MALTEGWKNTIKSAEGNAAWDAHDAIIIKVVKEFNDHQSELKKNNYFKEGIEIKRLPPYIIKMMCWVETGAGIQKWNTNPMQIGAYKADPAMDVVLKGKEGTSLILPDKYKTGKTNALTADKIQGTPLYNIVTAVCYLIARFAKTEMINYQTSTTLKTDKLQARESLSSAAKRLKTDVDTLQRESGITDQDITRLRPGRELKYYPTQKRLVISGWHGEFTNTKLIAKRYNGGGDSDYETKLNFVKDSIIKRSNYNSLR